ncbi:zinc/cadmium/mercury/lead-transporting ATPase [Botrimarina mediterranea]|uniref:Zinc/cadmium/mercury/lead-transporting ATPase n=2 Tax=Botrimarina mediterranea TaxID=2528022 RepID=A0A518K7G9_9BACT|nr:zinc/cadmium/mercury/lead-transporting ATPase [Botrimarina mediterranea]
MRTKCNFLFAAVMSCLVGPTTTALAANPAPAQQVQIVAEKMCCQGCARKVTAQLYAARGVQSVSVDMPTHTLTVTLPQPSAVALGSLWDAAEKGDGGPTTMVIGDATFSFSRAESSANENDPSRAAAAPMTIAIDNLHCKGCAQKIAAQLYATKGVNKVSVDMQQGLLHVEAGPDSRLSPWALVDAVFKAGERPLSVTGKQGELSIAWATPAAPKTDDPNTQANLSQPNAQGIQR